jgi:hypothetical protein
MTKSRGINKPKAIWTPERDEQLRSLYQDNTTEVVAEIMGARPSQIYSRAKALGITKSAEFFASVHSGRMQRGKLNPNIVATQFKPGQKPWNTGTHYVSGGRSAETRFKKGAMSGAAQHNYVPIGTLRISKDGYLERKMTDDPSLYTARRWTFVHRLVWEAAHGPIPEGHMVVFIKGQFTNNVDLLTADRLECITRRENILRNSLWTSNPELAKLYQLKGRITQQVNRLKRKEEAAYG